MLQSYPLTTSQKAIWFEQQLYPNSPIFNIGGYTIIEGDINLNIFNTSIAQLIREQDALRIQIDREQPIQVFVEQLVYMVKTEDFSDEDQAFSFAIDWMKADFNIPFNLAVAPLFEFRLLKFGRKKILLYYKYHHIINDGLGTFMLVNRLADIYTNLICRKEEKEEEIFSYKDFISFVLEIKVRLVWQKD